MRIYAAGNATVWGRRQWTSTTTRAHITPLILLSFGCNQRTMVWAPSSLLAARWGTYTPFLRTTRANGVVARAARAVEVASTEVERARAAGAAVDALAMRANASALATMMVGRGWWMSRVGWRGRMEMEEKKKVTGRRI